MTGTLESNAVNGDSQLSLVPDMKAGHKQVSSGMRKPLAIFDFSFAFFFLNIWRNVISFVSDPSLTCFVLESRRCTAKVKPK